MTRARYVSAMQFPMFTDLGSLAEDLARRGANPKVRAAIMMAWRAQSCLGDLRQAEESVRVLRAITAQPRQSGDPEPMIIERALMSASIMHYARATSTSGQKDERGSIQLERNRLTPEEWEDHSKIIDVRNQALAHVYSGRTAGDHTWHRDIFFAVETPNGTWAAASASNQTSYHEATLRRLERMLPIAIREVKAKFQKRIAAVSTMLNGEIEIAHFRKHAFDPLAVFGSEETVRAIIEGRQFGETSIWVNEHTPRGLGGA